jgi:putative transposase
LLSHLSREVITTFVCYQFFKQIPTKFGSKIIYTDGAYWYDDVCKWLSLNHINYETDLKDIMERFIQQIKDRTECFDDNFPCKITECERNM